MRHYLQLLTVAVIMLICPLPQAFRAQAATSQAEQGRITAKGVILDAQGEPVIGAYVAQYKAFVEEYLSGMEK